MKLFLYLYLSVKIHIFYMYRSWQWFLIESHADTFKFEYFSNYEVRRVAWHTRLLVRVNFWKPKKKITFKCSKHVDVRGSGINDYFIRELKNKKIVLNSVRMHRSASLVLRFSQQFQIPKHRFKLRQNVP